jgi:hypothetical protein
LTPLNRLHAGFRVHHTNETSLLISNTSLVISCALFLEQVRLGWLDSTFDSCHSFVSLLDASSSSLSSSPSSLPKPSNRHILRLSLRASARRIRDDRLDAFVNLDPSAHSAPIPPPAADFSSPDFSASDFSSSDISAADISAADICAAYRRTELRARRMLLSRPSPLFHSAMWTGALAHGLRRVTASGRGHGSVSRSGVGGIGIGSGSGSGSDGVNDESIDIDDDGDDDNDQVTNGSNDDGTDGLNRTQSSTSLPVATSPAELRARLGANIFSRQKSEHESPDSNSAAFKWPRRFSACPRVANISIANCLAALLGKTHNTSAADDLTVEMHTMAWQLISRANSRMNRLDRLPSWLSAAQIFAALHKMEEAHHMTAHSDLDTHVQFPLRIHADPLQTSLAAPSLAHLVLGDESITPRRRIRSFQRIFDSLVNPSASAESLWNASVDSDSVLYSEPVLFPHASEASGKNEAHALSPSSFRGHGLFTDMGAADDAHFSRGLAGSAADFSSRNFPLFRTHRSDAASSGFNGSHIDDGIPDNINDGDSAIDDDHRNVTVVRRGSASFAAIRREFCLPVDAIVIASFAPSAASLSSMSILLRVLRRNKHAVLLLSPPAGALPSVMESEVCDFS